MDFFPLQYIYVVVFFFKYLWWGEVKKEEEWVLQL